ncbi:CubicO group peptidase (beta-lactamase class C family) [Elizabethkingia sp. YR214]|uniref:serine hydrolase domain-containing protein n=1 Tax=Elizabethkingia sp. YR214 TaxID=2135667 RepID=UPI000D31FC17|nr:serine hydrolase domain-containing protein [Elizabethkingia sp. YR214]PUB31015.1 CubicO group peptidase (beta-lactamase class C family) [Elizabethkingia sp. YR214]
MKKPLFLLMLFIGVYINNIIAQSKTDSEKLDEYFTALTAIKNFNGNVIVARKTNILLDKSYNIAENVNGLKIEKDSKFIIASVSKIFVKYAILKLAELNKLKLSDKLDKYISGFEYGNKITIEQLIYHQSGLPRELKDYEKYENISMAQTIELARKEKLQFEPGTQTLYSNIGYLLLHYIIDKVSGNYWNFMNKNILQEYQMKNTGEFNAVNKIDHFAYGYNLENGKITPVSKENINRFETGNYFSTVTDLYNFSKQILSGKFLKKELALKMYEKENILTQAGGRPGYRAYYYQNLSSGITFIFTSNYTDIPFQQVTTDIINLMENKPYKIPEKTERNAITLPDNILQRYTGKYALEADPSQVFTFSLVNHKLVITDKDNEKTILYPDTETTFFDNPSSQDSYNFSINTQSQKYDLTIISTGVKLKTKRLQ